MLFRQIAFATSLAATAPLIAHAQSTQATSDELHLELNAVEDVQGACRLTFLAKNETGQEIEKVVFETVIFDESGSVTSLKLFDFRDLPTNRPRVRQFDLPGTTCVSVGQALINGASTCLVGGAESAVCQNALSLNSRVDTELLG